MGAFLIAGQASELTGELHTGSDYKLIVLKEAWEDVPTIIEDYGWNMLAYMVAKNDVTEFEYDWDQSQLAGFTKGKDLAYFLREICDCDYKHDIIYAPTKEILQTYKKGEITWGIMKCNIMH